MKDPPRGFVMTNPLGIYFDRAPGVFFKSNALALLLKKTTGHNVKRGWIIDSENSKPALFLRAIKTVLLSYVAIICLFFGEEYDMIVVTT